MSSVSAIPETPETIEIPARWTCQECGKPIDPEDGFVEIFQVNPVTGVSGGYPCEPSEDIPSPGGETGLVWLSEFLKHESVKKTVGVRVIHEKCDFEFKAGGYFLVIEEVSSDREILAREYRRPELRRSR